MPTRTQFKEWMRIQGKSRTSGLSEASVVKYGDNTPDNADVRNIFLTVTGNADMFHCTSRNAIESIISTISGQSFDIIGKCMYSCGVKKYLQFLISQGLVTP